MPGLVPDRILKDYACLSHERWALVLLGITKCLDLNKGFMVDDFLSMNEEDYFGSEYDISIDDVF